MTIAREFAEELERRAIACETASDSVDETVCTTINNAPVTIYFSKALDRDIRWQAGDDTMHRGRDVTANDLAEDVIDSLINPA